MGDRTAIEWTDASWNPIVGCSILSPGCINCYAMREAGWRLRNTERYRGLTEPSKKGPVWNGSVRPVEKALDQPLRWRRPRRIFVNSMGDLFHEGVPDKWIDQVFAVMALAPRHQFQVLTKRAERMRDHCKSRFGGEFNTFISDAQGELSHELSEDDVQDACDWTDHGKPLPNVWLGVSAEDQERADDRIPLLLDTPAAVRWVSYEPALGPIDFEVGHINWLRGFEGSNPPIPRLDWIVAGGESGPHARPMQPEWARSIRDQCSHAGVPFFFKQWGEWLHEDDAYDRSLIVIEQGPPPDGMYRVGKKRAGRLLDGVEHSEYPA